MKYRIKYTDTSLLFLTPFAFLNMDGTNVYNVEKKKGWWIFGKWESVYKTKDIADAYIEYFKLKHNIVIEDELEFPHNKNKNKKQTCHLEFKSSDNPEYRYGVGYKPYNYNKFYHICFSPDSYEDALMRLYCDLEVKKLINKI